MTESISLVVLTKGFRDMILHMLIEIDGGNYTGRIYRVFLVNILNNDVQDMNQWSYYYNILNLYYLLYFVSKILINYASLIWFKY